jgi:hypothetical protein
MLQVEYEDISQWGYSSTELCLKVGNLGDLHLKCSTLDVMISIFTNYLNYLKVNIDFEKSMAKALD